MCVRTVVEIVLAFVSFYPTSYSNLASSTLNFKADEDLNLPRSIDMFSCRQVLRI